MKLIKKLLCYLGFHLYDPYQLEKGWRYTCLNCGNEKKIFRSISFEHDIKPFILENNYKGSLRHNTLSFDNLLICSNKSSEKQVVLLVPSEPIYDGDIFLNDIFIEIIKKLG